MSEVIPKMPRCPKHRCFYVIGGDCPDCLGEAGVMIEQAMLQHIEQRLEYEETIIGPKPIRFTIPLKLCSMKNSKIQTRSGKVFKNPEVKAFERDFQMLVPSEYRNLGLGSFESPLWAIVTVYYASRRADLSTDLLYDCLQTSGVIANDRFIRRKHEDALIDRDNPRIEIELRVLEL